MIVIIMGAAGAGKTTVGTALASSLGWRFIDADTLHSPSSVEKIRAGIPLTDADRAPWLERLHDVVFRAARDGTDVVLACSALKERYRAALAEGVPGVRWVFLDADAELLVERLRRRAGHFAGPEIVASQLETLEEPRDALTLDAELPVDELIDVIRARLGLANR